MHAHGFCAMEFLIPQFFVQGVTVPAAPRVQAVLSPGAGEGHIGTPPLEPPTPVVVMPPVPVVVMPPVPVVDEPPVPGVLEPPVPAEVIPPVPVVDEPPVPLLVEPPVPEPFEPPVPSLTVSPLVQPYPMRPSATIALNPATTNEVRFI
jgi:hypothetical protein